MAWRSTHSGSGCRRRRFDAPHRLARLAVLIEQALSGRIRLTTEIRKMSKMLLVSGCARSTMPPRVVIDNHASNTHTVCG
jgi:[protein-PII] uridylyltransferase